MIRHFRLVAFLVAVPAVASADVSPAGVTITEFDPEAAVAPVSTVEGKGIKVGEGTILTPVFGLESGFVSNVFYQDTNTTGSGMLRLLAQVGAGSLTRQRLLPTDLAPDDPAMSTAPVNPGSFQYRANLRASYDMMLSGNEAVSNTGGVGLGALFDGIINPTGRFSVELKEDFRRLIRAANFETSANTNRDINTAGLQVQYHPSDSAFSGYAWYTNTVDVFERTEQQFANRLLQEVGVHPVWRWLPQTSLFLDISQDFNTPIGTTMKPSAFPFTALGGLATLLTLKTTFNLQAGYTNGFYSTGPSYSAPVVGASLGYRYTPLGRVVGSYEYIHVDSINANFYRDHVARLWFQQYMMPFIIMIQPELRFRQYEGVSAIVPGAPDVRNDTIISIVAGASYNFRNWLAATVDYHFTSVSSDFRYMPSPGFVDNPSFVRHELLAGLRIAM